MARNTGVDILSIKPDAEMGLGQDTNIPVSAVALDQVNKATQDMRDYDHQRQIMKYDHQLKQRDNLIKGISEGEVSTKQILPEDKAFYKEKEDAVRKAFLAVTSMEPDDKGNNVALDNYHQAKQELQDASTMLQARYVGINKLRQDRANTNLPTEQAALDQHLGKVIGADKMAPVEPFQKAYTRDFDEILATGLNGALVTSEGQPINTEKVTTKTTKGPKGTTVQTTATPATPAGKSGKNMPIAGEVKEDGKLPEIITEPDVMLSDATVYRNIENKYNNPKEESFRVNVERTYEDYQGTTDQTLQNHILLADSRLAQKDQEFGIPTIKMRNNIVGPPNPDNPNDMTGKESDTGHYPSQINYRMVGDKMVIEETPVSLAAKLAIAFAPVQNYVAKGKKSINPEAVKINHNIEQDEKELNEKMRANREKERNEWYDSKTRRISATKPDGNIVPTGIKGNALNGIPLSDATKKDGVYNLTAGAGKKYLGQLQQVLGDKVLPDYLLQSNEKQDAISIVVKNGTVQAIEIGGKLYDRQEIENLQKSRDKEAKGSDHQEYPLEQSYLSGSKKVYKYNGKEISEDAINKAAKEWSMSAEEYRKKFNIE